MDGEDLVRDYYGGDDLATVALGTLERSGADVDALTLDDLSGLDQLHAGSIPATEHLLDALALDEASTVLDVGCGVGGPARLAAARYGCDVTGIDLSPSFVELARSLTERLGLTSQVRFDLGSAAQLPYPDAAFDRAMLNHAGMNMADKATVFAEVRRVLEPGGRFALYEQMRIGDGELTYPLPWADDESSSFVETREGYAELLAGAGFRVELDEDRTPANAAAGPPGPGELGPGDLFGSNFDQRMHNAILAAMTGTLASVVMVARAT